MGTNTPNHQFYRPNSGETDWGTAKNGDWNDLDTRLVIKDTIGNRPAAGTADRWFLSTDTYALYYDDGSSWVNVFDNATIDADTLGSNAGSHYLDHTNFTNVGATDHHTTIQISDSGTPRLTQPSDLNFGQNISASDDGDGTVTVDVASIGVTDQAWVSRLVDSPNGHLMNTVLDDTESAEISVPVPTSQDLKVYRWGGYQISDGTAPVGLQVQLLDGSDTVQASANTVNNESTDPATPVASYGNSSGSMSVFKLAVNNGTGSTISSPGVGGIFSYVVE